MTCRKVAQFIDDYVDGHLDELLSHDIDTHLVSCTKCYAKIEELNRLKALLKSFVVYEPEPDYFDHATELILAVVSGKSQMARQVH